MTIPQIVIKPAKEKSILRKHPWVFSGAIKRMDNGIEDGDLVEVIANKGRHLAYGHYQEGSISVRLLLFDNEKYTEDFFSEKIKNAFLVRKSIGLTDDPSTNIYRLVHAEGDQLPGLIIDHYAGNLVIQCHSIGMYRSIDKIKAALLDLYGNNLKSIYLKSSATLPGNYEGYEGDGFIHGSADAPIVARENGLRFKIDWINGQKTGFFIDQRENRNLLGKLAKGKKILNTFCYSGGFSISALQNGAQLVHSLDSSKKAIQLTDENVELGGFQPSTHKSFCEDAMEFIKDIKEDYDIIVLDPPAFAKRRSAKHKAVQGYKRLNANAIRQIKPGGIIFTFSCSQVVDKNLFNNTIVAAAISAERKVRILYQLHQPADHPISATHPEGEYLKGLVIQVE